MMATVSSSSSYNRKRPRRLSSSNGASNTNTSAAHSAPTPLTLTQDQQQFHHNQSSFRNTSYIRKKQQQYPTTGRSSYKPLDYTSLDIINLDSDAEDYAFRDELPELPAPTRTTHRNHPVHHHQPTTSAAKTKPDDFSYFETVIDEDDEDFEFDYDNNNNLGFDEDTQSTSSSASSFSYNSFNLLNLKLGNTAIHNTPPPPLTKKKSRTRSLPQLPYARLNYRSTLNKHDVLQKIGDVKATVIQHVFNNYTYQQQVPELSSRKFSFNTDLPPTFPGPNLIQQQQQQQQQQQPYSNSTESTASSSGATTQSTLTSIEDTTPCDDKDGHYLINPGALFANDRYQIQSLLGQGTFGKVIKAYDRYNDDIVAIKIIRAIPKYREASKIELRVLSMLKKHDPTNVNQCIHLRECFDYRDHICIVTDILKISLYDFLDRNQFLAFPGSHVQAVAKQLLVSVAFMHDLNLIHTDLKPENILLKDDSYIKKPYHKPGYSKTYYRKILVDPKIYTIDFGSAIFNDEYHSSIVSTRHYRAPEIILGIGWSFPCDIWSIGCILVELITGDALFKTHENVQHMAMMEKVLSESMDLTLVRKCFNQFYHDNSSNTAGYHVRRRSSVSSLNNANMKDCIANSFSKKTGRLLFPTAKTQQKLINEVDQLHNLADIIGNKVGFKYSMNLSLKESLNFFKVPKKSYNDYEFWFWFIDLVKCMLTYDPEKRINAVDAMNHRWFNCGILDDGTTDDTN